MTEQKGSVCDIRKEEEECDGYFALQFISALSLFSFFYVHIM